MNVLLAITLLVLSNVFMTAARHGHLRFMDRPLWIAVVASWDIRPTLSGRIAAAKASGRIHPI